jgi:hypothetical protein
MGRAYRHLRGETGEMNFRVLPTHVRGLSLLFLLLCSDRHHAYARHSETVGGLPVLSLPGHRTTTHPGGIRGVVGTRHAAQP